MIHKTWHEVDWDTIDPDYASIEWMGETIGYIINIWVKKLGEPDNEKAYFINIFEPFNTILRNYIHQKKHN